MTSEVEEPQCIGCGEPEPWCCCEWLKLWQLRRDLGEQISVVLRQYWERADQYSEIVPSHIEALQYEVGEIEATNYPHEKMLAKNATLAAENARLREGLIYYAGGIGTAKWNLSMFWMLAERGHVGCIVPAHIVALQEAIYREECE